MDNMPLNQWGHAVIKQEDCPVADHNLVSIDHQYHFYPPNEPGLFDHFPHPWGSLVVESGEMVNSFKGKTREWVGKLYLVALETNHMRRFDRLMHILSQLNQQNKIIYHQCIQPPSEYQYNIPGRGIAFNTADWSLRRVLQNSPPLLNNLTPPQDPSPQKYSKYWFTYIQKADHMPQKQEDSAVTNQVEFFTMRHDLLDYQYHFYPPTDPKQSGSVTRHPWERLMSEGIEKVSYFSGATNHWALDLYLLTIETNPMRRFDRLMNTLNQRKPKDKNPDFIEPPPEHEYTSPGTGVVFNTASKSLRRIRQNAGPRNNPRQN